MYWQTLQQQLPLDRPLIMGILNVTPDSFSDGGRYSSVEAALARAEAMIGEGADILDIGGESTRPGSTRVDAETERQRTAPILSAIATRFDTPLSIDTSKSAVAKAAIESGATIINDISGLRWDCGIAKIAAETGAGLVLMHSRGSFETMHIQPPLTDPFANLISGLHLSIEKARKFRVSDQQIVLDIGIGFGKTPDQNLELIAKLDRIIDAFTQFPVLVGASRKSFIGRLLGDVPAEKRVFGSIAAAVAAVLKGAKILRVHDVKATVDAVKVARQMI